MRLLELGLANWRGHKKFFHKFKAGSTCILGPNGSGKSSLLAAVKYLLTDSWGDTCDKAGNIRIGSKGEAFAEGVWEHAGTEFTVRRNLRGKSWLQIGPNAADRLNSATEIEARLRQLLGVSSEALLGMSFVDQNCIASFVDETRAKWLDSVAQLCDVDSVERLYKLLSERLTADRGLAGTFVDQSDECERSLAEGRRRLEEVDEKLRTAEADRLSKVEQAGYRADLQCHRERDAARATLVRCRKLLAKWEQVCSEKVTVRTAKLAKLQQRVDKLEHRQAVWLDDGPKWQNVLLRSREADKAKQEIERATKDLEHLDVEVTGYKRQLSEAQKANDVAYAEQDNLTQRQILLRQNLQQLTGDLKLFAGGTCPTCHQSVANFDVTLKRRQVAQVEQELGVAETLLREAVLTVRRVEADVKRLHAAVAAAEQVRQAAQNSLDRAKQVFLGRPTAESVADAQTSLADAGTVTAKLTALRASVRKLSENLDKLTSQRTFWQRQETEAKETLAKSVAPLRMVEVLERALNRHTAADAVHQELLVQRAQVQKDMKTTQATLLANQELKARCEAGGEWVGALERWRQAVHRDALQKVIVRGYLEERVINVNKRLLEFSAPFSVALGDDLLLVAKKANGIVHSIKQLSGGQQVVLAAAYRLAVNTQDLLVLDEPTANLDQANLHMFRDFLRDLSRTLSREGKQLLMVTHEESLVSAAGGGLGVFDDVVRLK